MSNDSQIVSIQDRLKNIARSRKRPVNEIYQFYGMERFLFRLSQSRYVDKFILKGGLLISVLDALQSRATRDIDLLGFGVNEPAVLTEIVGEICGMEVDDGVFFDRATLIGTVIKEGADYEGVRVKVMGYLGRVRLPFRSILASEIS